MYYSKPRPKVHQFYEMEDVSDSTSQLENGKDLSILSGISYPSPCSVEHKENIYNTSTTMCAPEGIWESLNIYLPAWTPIVAHLGILATLTHLPGNFRSCNTLCMFTSKWIVSFISAMWKHWMCHMYNKDAQLWLSNIYIACFYLLPHHLAEAMTFDHGTSSSVFSRVNTVE